jgi:uncharacterized protein (DUF58 family)
MHAVIRSFNTWLFQLRGPERGEVVLVQRRIFILPSRSGLLFAFVLLLMLTGSINYTLSLGFILTFLLASLAIIAMLHTFRNLAGLRITAARTPPVFAGDFAHFRICINNPAAMVRYSVALTRDKRDVAIVDVPAESAVIATAAVAAPRRGRLKPGRLTLFTRFPVGLFYAWSYIDLETHCMVYPRPAAPGLPLPPLTSAARDGSGLAQGNDDFAGLRQYHPGDSPRHIAWKAAARGQGLLTKQFIGRGAGELRFTLDSPPRELGLEDKLSQLARWVLDAHAAGLAYALDVPRASVPAGTDEAHRDRCLEALALFEPGSAPDGEARRDNTA